MSFIIKSRLIKNKNKKFNFLEFNRFTEIVNLSIKDIIKFIPNNDDREYNPILKTCTSIKINFHRLCLINNLLSKLVIF